MPVLDPLSSSPSSSRKSGKNTKAAGVVRILRSRVKMALCSFRLIPVEEWLRGTSALGLALQGLQRW